MVVVSWVSGQEEDHVIAIAKGHELQARKPDHHGQWKWMFGVSCNTPGVCHSLSSGFELKHDRLSGDEPNLNLDIAPLLTYRLN
jgi:hypothetical protein